MEFSRQEYWSGLPFPSPGDLPDPGIEPGPPTLQADALPSDPLMCVLPQKKRGENEIRDGEGFTEILPKALLWGLVMKMSWKQTDAAVAPYRVCPRWL